jgi:hypothetical protein
MTNRVGRPTPASGPNEQFAAKKNTGRFRPVFRLRTLPQVLRPKRPTIAGPCSQCTSPAP